ncbi:suppressor of G2 allele of SKP1 [Biomphalaria pfeifferi]|uniref:Suppressor of G2 allele of SKP1 n=1 Tax=Biomphalaria pfeifferi TaxID=112525 RepID=A0AAD8B264_BIOPF|nr:suppressor of G2 allele of SKP1 [Biomphalaria pfeifferi]
MASEICGKGNEEYVNENYDKAVELYTEALNLDDKRDDIYCHRAQGYLQLKKYSDAVLDCEKALEINEHNSKAYLKKGSALYELQEFQKALAVFQEGQKRFVTDGNFELWISKCQEELHKSEKTKTDAVCESGHHKEKTLSPNSVSVESPKVKYDWYQTHTHVVITVLLKNITKENLTVESENRKLKVVIKEPAATLELLLAHQIDPHQTSFKILSTKIEIKLKKCEGILWSKLEGQPDSEDRISPVAEGVPAYPSSSLSHRDWDKIAQQVTEEEKDEKLEGDAALNQFFQKIYADASDETKRAMMKSFTESGGTVLSTNWSEVGSKKVDVKPPDGMEFKKWEY